MTELSDELLVAYVDGQLARDQSAAVERVLGQDEVAAQRVEAMRAANGRLEAAFEAMLAGELTALTSLSEQQSADAVQSAKSASAALLRRAGPVGVIGAAICLIFAGALGGYSVRTIPQVEALVPAIDVPIVTGASARRTIGDDLIIAHTLFGRDTLTIGLESQQNIDLIRFQLADVIGSDLVLPDLSASGLTFRRAQILKRDDDAIAQLAYLPAAGDPVALYARWDEGKDVATTGRQIDGVSATQWRQKNISYLLAGRMPLPDMNKLAGEVRAQIAANRILTSDLPEPMSAAEARSNAADPEPPAVQDPATPGVTPSSTDSATAN
jgi:anti-sigma factor RsiW